MALPEPKPHLISEGSGWEPFQLEALCQKFALSETGKISKKYLQVERVPTMIPPISGAALVRVRPMATAI